MLNFLLIFYAILIYDFKYNYLYWTYIGLHKSPHIFLISSFPTEEIKHLLKKERRPIVNKMISFVIFFIKLQLYFFRLISLMSLCYNRSDANIESTFSVLNKYPVNKQKIVHRMPNEHRPFIVCLWNCFVYA